MTTTPARDAIHRLFESGRTSYRLDELIDAAIAEDRATQAAEVHAAALEEAAKVAHRLPTPDCAEMSSLTNAWGLGTWAVANELRRMAAAARPDNTTGA